MTLSNSFLNRRGLLKSMMGLAASHPMRGVVAGLGALGTASLVSAAPTMGYRALVCIYLFGGNDAFNLIVPMDGSGYQLYKAARGPLSLAQSSLLPITPKTSDGHSYGLHGAAGGLQSLFNQGVLGVVANVGSLVTPITKADYISGSNLPYQLFSHEDQTTQWMNARPDAPQSVGWAGAVADILQAQNQANSLSMNISINGDNLFQTGATAVPYSIDPGGVFDFDGLNGAGNSARLAAFQDIADQAVAGSNLLEHQSGTSLADTRAHTASLISILNQAVPLKTVFPRNFLGDQLAMVAKLISLRSALGASRQIFFVNQDGFDTHDDQLTQHAGLLGTLGDAMNAFYNATVEMGVANSVTTFTESEFGRTLTSNHGGSDHGWGSHHLVMGGSVRGGDIYGAMPDLTLGGPDDADEGRMIPKISTYQYAATLGKWLGVGTSDLATIFPNLSQFNTPDLGFLTA